jgi:hypothetical protein
MYGSNEVNRFKGSGFKGSEFLGCALPVANVRSGGRK